MKRALRVDKIRLAAIEATLKLYRDPDRLAERLPTLRLLARPRGDRGPARRLLPAVAAKPSASLHGGAVRMRSQIGSGALPLDTMPAPASSSDHAREAPGAGPAGGGLRGLPGRWSGASRMAG